MTTFFHAHANGPDWRQAVEICARQLAGIGAGATLGFVYASDWWVDELEQMVVRLREATGVSHWVGTVGLGISVTGRDYFDEPALAVMVADMPVDTFRLFSVSERGSDSLREQFGGWCTEKGARVAIVHADPTDPATPMLIPAVGRELDGFLVGGLTSSRGQHLQIADTPRRGGLSGVLLAGSVEFATGLSQGCSPIGPVHQVTACENNVAVEIDGRPALDVLYQDLGELRAPDLTRFAGHIFVAFPIAGSDTGDYLVRNLTAVDTRRKLLAMGEPLTLGAPVMFCRRDADTARQDLSRMLARLGRRLSAPPKAGLYFSCLGRGPGLFGSNREIQMISEALGEFPLVGFYANGEIHHDRLYGYTGVLGLFH